MLALSSTTVFYKYKSWKEIDVKFILSRLLSFVTELIFLHMKILANLHSFTILCVVKRVLVLENHACFPCLILIPAHKCINLYSDVNDAMECLIFNSHVWFSCRIFTSEGKCINFNYDFKDIISCIMKNIGSDFYV